MGVVIEHLATGILLGVAAGSVCNAATDDTIARCAASESKDARVACLENALRALTNDGEVRVVDEATNADGEVKETGDAAIEELGSEQVEARNSAEDEGTVSATVVDFDFVGYRRLLVQLDNGQIWRQIDGDRTNVDRSLRNEVTFGVELWESALGGYRMRITPLDRTIRVERLK